MAGELPSFDFGSESDDKKDEKGKRDTRKSSVSSALGNLIKPEHQETFHTQAAAREREIGELLFGEHSSEGKSKKKKKEKTSEKPAILSVDRSEPVRPAPEPLYTPPELGLPTVLSPEATDLEKDTSGADLDKKEPDYKAWAESAQEFELPDGAGYGGETIIYLHDDPSQSEQQPREENGGTVGAESTPGVQSGRELSADSGTRPPAVPTEVMASYEQPGGQYVPPEAIPTPPIPPSVEPRLAGSVPERPLSSVGARNMSPTGEPYAPVTELADDLPRVAPAAEYVSVNPVPRVGGTWDPAEAYRQHGHQPVEQGVTAKELDDAVYYATKYGQNRGVVAGLFAGGVYEHFKHRRREKRAEKRYSEQSRQLQKAREDSHFYFTEQTKQQAEHNRQLEKVERQTYVHNRQAERTATQIAELTEENAKLKMSNPDLARQSVPDAGETTAIPREHVLQSSAWHNIEIDKRTGRPVETPTFAYGNEYYRERAHESRPGDQRSTVAGGVALAGATGADNQNGARSVPPQPYIPSATRQGPPPSRGKRTASTIRGHLTNPGNTGPLWPYLVALVVILFCLIALLH